VSDHFYNLAARNFPNFPRQVIEMWFEHVKSAGWPPPFDAFGFSSGPWRSRVFRDRPLTFWRSVTWSQSPVLVKIRLASLEHESMTMVKDLRTAFALGFPHPLHMPIPNASARIASFVAALRQKGRLPVPPALLVVGNQFEVLDGYHRVSALVFAQDAGLPLVPMHEAWVAWPPH
jgi:hypothetical protein